MSHVSIFDGFVVEDHGFVRETPSDDIVEDVDGWDEEQEEEDTHRGSLRALLCLRCALEFRRELLQKNPRRDIRIVVGATDEDVEVENHFLIQYPDPPTLQHRFCQHAPQPPKQDEPVFEGFTCDLDILSVCGKPAVRVVSANRELIARCAEHRRTNVPNGIDCFDMDPQAAALFREWLQKEKEKKQ